MIRKKRCTFMIEPDVLERLHSITARTGLSQSEQIRQGIRWWLESREWPSKAERSEAAAAAERTAGPAVTAAVGRGKSGNHRPRRSGRR